MILSIVSIFNLLSLPKMIVILPFVYMESSKIQLVPPNSLTPSEEGSDFAWTQFLEVKNKYHDYEFPKVSIVVPAYNCSQTLAATLESVLNQDYPSFELIIIDGESTDRTLEIAKSFHDERIHLFSVSVNQTYEMMNKGITQAEGEYINFLYPGDFYLLPQTLKIMMSLALDNKKPEMIYCGTLLRDGKSEVKILHRNLTIKLLKKGLQPASLQSCWIKTATLRQLGKFDTLYKLRGGFDFMCRFCLAKDLRVVSTTRILTDYDLRWVTKRMVIRHFWETRRSLLKYFGFLTMIRWLFIRKTCGGFLNYGREARDLHLLGNDSKRRLPPLTLDNLGNGFWLFFFMVFSAAASSTLGASKNFISFVFFIVDFSFISIYCSKFIFLNFFFIICTANNRIIAFAVLAASE